MNIQPHKIGDTEIAEIISESIVIQNVDDGLDLLGNVYYQGFDKVVVHQKNITEDFFDLKNKMAGEILQKFSNYRVHLAIVGDFSKVTRNSLNDFIRESNKGRHVNFANSLDEAFEYLAR